MRHIINRLLKISTKKKFLNLSDIKDTLHIYITITMAGDLLTKQKLINNIFKVQKKNKKLYLPFWGDVNILMAV